MISQKFSKLLQFKKFWRFTTIYGLRRSFTKAIGRLRHPLIRSIGLRKEPLISVIGSGQFMFSTICYFIRKNKGLVFHSCYDINVKNAETLGYFYRFKSVAKYPSDVFKNKDFRVLYIASNHASHTPYAIEAIKAGIAHVYIEKPIAVSVDQFFELINTWSKSESILYAGYNRPYSKAVILLKNIVLNNSRNEKKGAFTINYFISGHLIPKDHWYRNPKEGTRICGNVGHWIDLTVHVLSWRKMPALFDISITYSNPQEPDDNIIINMTSELGDLVSIMLTSRSEPFEGINETMNFQYGNTTAKIDDFRSITIWEKERLIRKKFYPKDVGHERAVLQPFGKWVRDWKEVEISTLLMLHIAEMVKKTESHSTFNILNGIKTINNYKNVKTK